MEKLKIKKVDIEEEIPYQLLYLADPSKEAVEEYLKRGICYIGYWNDELAGVYVLLPTRPFTIELVNLAIAEKYQKRGFGKQLLYHAQQVARKKNIK